MNHLSTFQANDVTLLAIKSLVANARNTGMWEGRVNDKVFMLGMLALYAGTWVRVRLISPSFVKGDRYGVASCLRDDSGMKKMV